MKKPPSLQAHVEQTKPSQEGVCSASCKKEKGECAEEAAAREEARRRVLGGIRWSHDHDLPLERVGVVLEASAEALHG